MKKEMEYRVNKYILRLLINRGIINKNVASDIQVALIKQIDPPYKSVEEIGDFEEYRKDTSERKHQENSDKK